MGPLRKRWTSFLAWWRPADEAEAIAKRDPADVQRARVLNLVATLALLADVAIYYFTLEPLQRAFGANGLQLRTLTTPPEIVTKALAVQYALRMAAAAGFAIFLVRRRLASADDLGLTLRNFRADAAWTLRSTTVLVLASALFIASGIAVMRLGGWRPHLGDDMPLWPVALLCAPLAEEMVYRSLLVPGLRTGYYRKETIVVSGLIFYALHLGYGYSAWKLHYIVAGMLLSWAFLQRRRLWICALWHTGGNVLVMLDDLVLRHWPAGYKALLGYLPK